jgi:RNA recognition motif-containing protein
MEVKLYVGNLAHSTTEEELQTLFAQAGQVTSVNLIRDPDRGQSKGIAYVTLSTEAEAEQAVTRFNSFVLDGRALQVSMAKQMNEASTPVPGGHRGQLSAFSHSGHEPAKVKPSQPRAAPSGYQSRLSAFGAGSGPVAPRRRGRSQRH